MLIDRNIRKYLVFAEDSILNALQKISDNKCRIVFAVAENGLLEGVLTDGDFRRWVTRQSEIDLRRPVLEAMNRSYRSAGLDDRPASIEEKFQEGIDHIPLVDRHGRLAAVAVRRSQGLNVAGRNIGEGYPTFVIAEIGNNHNGDVGLAKKLVDQAKAAGADCAKFQMRTMDALYAQGIAASDPKADLGTQYTMDLLEKFQLEHDELLQVFEYCHGNGIIPLCTPWDEESLEALQSFGMPAYKLASADLTNHGLLMQVIATGRPVFCSTGMSTELEIKEAVRILRERNAPHVLMHCNSTYPTPFKDVNLAYLDRLREIGGGIVGYSGHERGYSVAVAAVARGAKVVEKHFTLDRDMEGVDHKVSLLPNELRAMIQAIREVEEAIGEARERTPSQGEMMNREVLGKSVTANRDIAKGETITRDMLCVRSPGQGLPPYRLEALVGLEAPRHLRQGECFFPSDLEQTKAAPRRYAFDRPFGVPVRYHDFARMVQLTNLDFVEFHFSYKDLEQDPKAFLEGAPNIGFTVHSPELFAGDHIMDLCSDDASYRRRSIDELKRVIEVTERLKEFFPRVTRPLIIVNAGGHTQDAPLEPRLRTRYYDRLAKSLEEVASQGVEVVPQTMPPFPWHFGGQRYQNLFMDAEEIARFCTEHQMRICLDTSHSKLACNHFGWSFRDFVDTVGPWTAHLHLVDASGVDGEGLQIGEGGIDFALLAEQLAKTCPSAPFIPEIWQGHKNSGEGFWIALDRLEAFFARGKSRGVG